VSFGKSWTFFQRMMITEKQVFGTISIGTIVRYLIQIAFSVFFLWEIILFHIDGDEFLFLIYSSTHLMSRAIVIQYHTLDGSSITDELGERMTIIWSCFIHRIKSTNTMDDSDKTAAYDFHRILKLSLSIFHSVQIRSN